MDLFQFNNAGYRIDHATAYRRWYDVDVEYKDNITEKCIGKIPRTENISTVLQILEIYRLE